jgi:hypothetical protein
MGQTTLDELKLTFYEKDSTAAAVVLYEHTNQYPDDSNHQIPTTDYYYRIKILDKNAFDLANVEIQLYKEQKMLNLRAVTYNLTENGTMNKDILQEKDVFSIPEREKWIRKKFTLPNIKTGSVIEYKYTISSPYLGIDDWYFQSDIPKIKSELDVSILGNYKYNMKIVGALKLDIKEASVDKKCVYIDGIGQGACATYSYGMNNIPAFEEEDYMLSKKNYISRLTFDLKSSTSYRGVVKNLATTWKKADKSLKDRFFNNQTSKKTFFKRRIPEAILVVENTLERAKKIYNFIRNHYTWNEKNWTNKDAKIRDAFDDKYGDVGEINLSLYNSLRAAKIEAKLLVLSTRDNGLPTKLHPVIFDYNYVIVKARIEGNNYYLDATEKFLPFGQIPFRTLNGDARTIDVKGQENQWNTLKPRFKSGRVIRAKLIINENSELEGDLTIIRNGYNASSQRAIIKSKNEDDYLELFENNHTNIEVEEYENINLDFLEKSLIEKFKIKLTLTNELSNKTRINPFFFFRMTENPFKLKERNYPVNFGYARKTNYSLQLKIPKNYKITQLPENLAISLPNKGGRAIIKISKKENVITLHLISSTNKKEYSKEEYYYLKEFFKQIIIAENSYIIIEKEL